MRTEDINYILGFVDGEGSFNISFIKRRDYRNRIKISASFNISQKEKEICMDSICFWMRNDKR